MRPVPTAVLLQLASKCHNPPLPPAALPRHRSLAHLPQQYTAPAAASGPGTAGVAAPKRPSAGSHVGGKAGSSGWPATMSASTRPQVKVRVMPWPLKPAARNWGGEGGMGGPEDRGKRWACAGQGERQGADRVAIACNITQAGTQDSPKRHRARQSSTWYVCVQPPPSLPLMLTCPLRPGTGPTKGKRSCVKPRMPLHAASASSSAGPPWREGVHRRVREGNEEGRPRLNSTRQARLTSTKHCLAVADNLHHPRRRPPNTRTPCPSPFTFPSPRCLPPTPTCCCCSVGRRPGQRAGR